MATQFIPKEVMDTIPKQIPVKYEAGRGNTQRPAGFDPESIGAQADIQGRSLVGYYKQVSVPGLPEVDAKGFPLPKFLARYDTNGVLQNISASEPYWATTGQGENDIFLQPKFNPQGELVETGENTNAAAGGSDFISQLGRIATETAPIWMSALGANLFTGANLLGGGAGAGAAGAGAAGAAGAGVPGGLLGSTLPAGAGAGGFFAPGVTAGAATLGIPTMTGAPAGVTPSVAGGLPGASSSIPTPSAVTTSTVAGAPAAAAPAVGAAAPAVGATAGTGAAAAAGGTGLISSAVDFAKENPNLTGAAIGAITGAIDAANAPKEQTTTTSIDPDIKREYMANLDRAKAAAAGLGVREFAQPGQMYTDAEKQLYNLGMTPFGAADIQQFFNPYEEQVVQGALGDIERSRLMQDVADRARATQARAFGGSRQGVQSALTNEAALRQAATTASGLRQTGFNTAADLGFRARPINVAGLTTSMNLGAQRDALRQAELDAQRNLELERLGITGGALGLQPARTGETSTQPLYSSTAGSALSGGLTGAYIGSLLQPKKA